MPPRAVRLCGTPVRGAPMCGTLQVVEYNSSSSLYEQLLQMRNTGVFISVHTSNLANSPLLQPGSAVFEVIQVRCGRSVGGWQGGERGWLAG